MKQILWFRRDLRIEDNAILAHANNEVLPIFIFDTNILNHLPKDDKRVTFIYQSVLNLKKQLQNIGLDLAIFYGDPVEIFEALSDEFDEVLFSCDFDSYAKQRDLSVQTLMPVQRFYDSFLIHPSNTLKNDGTPYKVFTPFYKSLEVIWESLKIEEYQRNPNLKLCKYDYSSIPTIESIGFEEQQPPEFLQINAHELLNKFIPKLGVYKEARDYFAINGTSMISTHLRFGLISPKQIFNIIKDIPNSNFYIRELFWREFYNYILYHFPKSEKENFNKKEIEWNHNKGHFQAWCEGNTGVPVIDAAMRHLNSTGTMHNRLRMIVASYLTKNLFLPWKWGEEYFALKLLDYEASSNIGSWQWGASTGADSVPYFRVFNPYTQSKKFDKEGIFIKSVIPELKDIEPKLLHKENGVQSNLLIDYPPTIVDIKLSRQNAINKFKEK